MTLNQSKKFVLIRLSLKKLKEARRFYTFGWERWCSASTPVPTPLTYYDAGGHRRFIP